jgi:REP element-mobilizing transposase RayT
MDGLRHRKLLRVKLSQWKHKRWMNMTRDPHSQFDPNKHHRKSIRLQGYDYSQAGAYFVTIVTYRRDCLFGKIENEEMILNNFGIIAAECWCAVPEHFPNVELGAYVIMPNHAHGVIVIRDDESASHFGMTDDDGRGAALLRPYANVTNDHKINVKPGSLGAIVRSYKSAVSYRINKEYNATGIWQRNYYEHIIRSEREMDNIWRYIEANPAQWDRDDENPHLVHP